MLRVHSRHSDDTESEIDTLGELTSYKTVCFTEALWVYIHPEGDTPYDVSNESRIDRIACMQCLFSLHL